MSQKDYTRFFELFFLYRKLLELESERMNQNETEPGEIGNRIMEPGAMHRNYDHEGARNMYANQQPVIVGELDQRVDHLRNMHRECIESCMRLEALRDRLLGVAPPSINPSTQAAQTEPITSLEKISGAMSMLNDAQIRLNSVIADLENL